MPSTIQPTPPISEKVSSDSVVWRNWMNQTHDKFGEKLDLIDGSTGNLIQLDDGGVPKDSGKAISDLWPIGSVYLTITTDDPADLFGFGTWEKLAEGKMLVGYLDGDADFGTLEGTGGAVDHKHSIDPPNTTSSGPSLTNKQFGVGATGAPASTHTHDVDIAAFDSETVKHLPPYLVVNMWKRTA